MKTGLATALLLAALVVPAAGHAADDKSVKQTIKENVKDSVITTKIKARYVKDKGVSARNINVETDGRGVVTLSGNASSRAEADRAVKIARATRGVTSVRNQIIVQPR